MSEAERRDLAKTQERRAELATWWLLWTLELLASSLYMLRSWLLLVPRRRLVLFQMSPSCEGYVLCSRLYPLDQGLLRDVGGLRTETAAKTTLTE